MGLRRRLLGLSEDQDMDISSAIRAAIERRNLSTDEMYEVMHAIMTGAATPAQIGGLLVALRMKGETVEEITAAARVMRELATTVDVADSTYLVDTCGTGGDGACTFNVSTASAFVVAAAGGRVAKHGNRSVSSRSGSADVLEAAGVNIDLSPALVSRCIEEIGVGFLFAPSHHGAMKYAVGPRREMGVRTIFNLLGPLTNPASAPAQLLGVFSDKWIEPLAHVLGRLGSRHVLVVHADDGLDEISIGATTQVAELRGGAVHRYPIWPEQFGIRRSDVSSLVVGSAEESLAMIFRALRGEFGPARDIVALNAGAAIYAAGIAPDLASGVNMASEAIVSGAALAKFESLTAFTRRLSSAH